MKNSMLKKDIKKECQRILNSCNRLYPGDKDFEFMIGVFKNHHSWKQKEGCGIEYISTKNTQYGTKCFWIYRTDDSETDISYIESMKPTSVNDKVKSACRTSIKSIILKFKDENYIKGVTKCPFTGEILNDDTVHVDHFDLTFEEIFDNWIELQRRFNPYLDCDTIKSIHDKKIDESSDGDTEVRFKKGNWDAEKSFIEFHNNNTNLRIVSKTANLGLLKNNQHRKIDFSNNFNPFLLKNNQKFNVK